MSLDREQFTYIIEDFSPGWQTRKDASQIPPGACVFGQNISITDGDQITTQPQRKVDAVIGDGTEPSTSSFNFTTREKLNIPLVQNGHHLYYKNSVSERYEILRPNVEYLKAFGFTQSSENYEFNDFCYFGNAVDPDMRWNGAHSALEGSYSGGETSFEVKSSVLKNDIAFHGTSTGGSGTSISLSPGQWASSIWNDFYVVIRSGPSAGSIKRITNTTSTTIIWSGSLTGVGAGTDFEIRQPRFAHTGFVIINGERLEYTGFTTEFTFTTASMIVADDGDGVAQAVTEYVANPRCDIHKMQNGYRVSASSRNSTVFRSKVFEPEDYTFGSPRAAGDGDIVDVNETPGNITGLGVFQGQIVATKESLIKPFSWSQDENNIFVADLRNTKVSNQCGNEFHLGLIEGDNLLLSTLTGKGVRNLMATSDVIDAQTMNLSYDIFPNIERLSFDRASSIFAYDRLFIACKTEQAGQGNDYILVWNLNKGAWELPIRGWSISSFFTAGGKLFGTDSVTGNVYELYSGRFDIDENEVELPSRYIWKSGNLNLGMPAQRKKFNALMIEGRIRTGTEMQIKVGYEEAGIVGTVQTTITSTIDSELDDIVLEAIDTSLYGVEAVGVNPFAGSLIDEENPDPNYRRFRVILTTEELPFYEMFLEFSAEGIGYQFGVTRIAINAVPENTQLKQIKKSFN